MIVTKGYNNRIGNITDTTNIFKDFITYITEKSENLSSEDTGLTLTYKSVFKFTIKVSSWSSFTIDVFQNDNQLVTSPSFLISNNYAADIRFRVSENDNVFVFEIATDNADKNKNIFNVQFIIVNDNGEYLFFKEAIQDTSAGSSVGRANALSKGVDDNLKVIDRLPYSYTDNGIEIIENKIIAGNTDFSKKINSLWDCSNIPPQNMYTINSKNYYSINSNTLTEV